MAKFWKDIERHEDVTEKHEITREEIDFLKEMQKELNTQNHVGQADPRYWVIRDYTKMYGESLDNADGITIYDGYSACTVSEIEYAFFEIDEVAGNILDDLEESGYELSSEEIENIKLSYDMESLCNALEEIDTYELSIFQYQEVPRDDGMFLTHEAAIEHLKKNDYHYSDNAHTYAKTAWRSKEEKLWSILQTVDFDALEVKG